MFVNVRQFVRAHCTRMFIHALRITPPLSASDYQPASLYPTPLVATNPRRCYSAQTSSKPTYGSPSSPWFNFLIVRDPFRILGKHQQLQLSATRTTRDRGYA